MTVQEQRDSYIDRLANGAGELSDKDIEILHQLFYSEPMIKLLSQLNRVIENLPRAILSEQDPEHLGFRAAQVQGQVSGALSSLNFLIGAIHPDEDEVGGAAAEASNGSN